MIDISIQFHGLPEEMFSVLESSTKDIHFHSAAIRFPPFTVEKIEDGLLSRAVEDATVRRLMLTLQPVVLPAATMGKLLDQNRDALIVDLGRLSKLGLEESCLSARDLGPAAAGAWKVIARNLKTHTSAGAMAINPDTHASVMVRTHRYTNGAKLLDDQGIRMIATGGGNSMTFRGFSASKS